MLIGYKLNEVIAETVPSRRPYFTQVNIWFATVDSEIGRSVTKPSSTAELERLRVMSVDPFTVKV